MKFGLFSLSALLVAAPLASASTPEQSDDFAKRMVVEKRATPQVVTTCKNKGQFALTFDDGPYSNGKKIEKTLEQYGGKGTLFVNGYNWACIYDNADELIARYKAGHQIAAHTWTHGEVPQMTAAQLNNQITLVETALMKILGIKPAFFRPPYGDYDAAALAILKKRGYTTVTWSFDSGDSAGLSSKMQEKNYVKLYRKFPTPQIALNHETYDTTPASIAVVVPRLVKAGYKLVTVAECLNMQPYQYIGKPSKRDASWTCAGTPTPGEL